MSQSSVLLIILGGISAGLIHVYSGPDHLAAIAPLVIKQQRRAWLTGLRWGFGHASGVAAVGILSLILRDWLPIDLISRWSDRLVGVFLIVLGSWTLRKAMLVHTHPHVHDAQLHEHIHVHRRRAAELHETKQHAHPHVAFGIGTLHGLAGSSHFLAIIPSLAMPSNALAVTYLAAYGAGTVAAMIVFASLIRKVSSTFEGEVKVYRAFMFVCSTVAILVGGIWLLGFGS